MTPSPPAATSAKPTSCCATAAPSTTPALTTPTSASAGTPRHRRLHPARHPESARRPRHGNLDAYASGDPENNTDPTGQGCALGLEASEDDRWQGGPRPPGTGAARTPAGPRGSRS